MTAEEFIRLHGEEDDPYELIDGELYERAVNGYTHDRVRNNLKELFDGAGVAGHGFKCWIEHSFRLGNSSIVTPDVAILRTGRLANRTGNSATTGSPDIAFEVAITDRPPVLQRKVSAYLRDGARAVCCVYPELKRLVVYTAHEWRELNEGDTLEFPDLPPGLGVQVSAIFDGV
jgi:Uma2 family endonuclease